MDRARTGRRLVDIVLSAIGLLLLSPIILSAAIAVKITSRGPAFFPAMRAGLKGRPFRMMKLRTMRQDASSGPKVTATGDQRITRVGRFLRASKIDELPQLLNVLKGDMAIVGPRPEDPDIVRALYGPAEWETLQVPPGLTSPGTIWYYTEGQDYLDKADVMRNYDVVMRRKLRQDAEYFKTATVVTDFKVILVTILVVLKRQFVRSEPSGDARRPGP